MEGRDESNCGPGYLFTLDEAAEFLRISKRYLYSMTFPRGPIRAVHLGRLVRYAPQTLHQYIEDQLNPPRSSAA